MRALRYDCFGPPDVARIVEAPEPRPARGEFAVRVVSASLNPVDWKIMQGDVRFVPLFVRPPRGVGVDFAGTIAAIGEGARGLAIGDAVFGMLSPFASQGSIAETIVAPARAMARMPAEIDFAGAASLPIAAGTAAQAVIDHARVARGQRVLVTGAAGGVGGYAVQLAHHVGAHVTGVCSAANAGYVRALGADDVVDYAARDFAQGDARYDVVLDAAPSHTFARARRVLTDSGVYVTTMPGLASIAAQAWLAIASRQRCVNLALRRSAAMLARLAAFARAGALRPTVTQRIGMAGVAEALGRMRTRHGRGKIVVDVAAQG